MGVIVARLTGGTDPRTVGSGSDRRHQRPARHGLAARHPRGPARPGQGRRAHPHRARAGAPVEVQALTGVAAVLGAWKSVFLRFHGGRGVATGVGGMLAVSPLIVPDRRARLLPHHRADALRLARLPAGHRLRGRRRRPLRARPAGSSPAWLLYVAARPGHRLDRPSRQHRAAAGGHGAPLRPLGPPTSPPPGSPAAADERAATCRPDRSAATVLAAQRRARTQHRPADEDDDDDRARRPGRRRGRGRSRSPGSGRGRRRRARR